MSKLGIGIFLGLSVVTGSGYLIEQISGFDKVDLTFKDGTQTHFSLAPVAKVTPVGIERPRPPTSAMGYKITAKPLVQEKSKLTYPASPYGPCPPIQSMVGTC